MPQPFVNLHTHSFYSILAGTMPPKRILETAHQLGHPGVALTDSGVGYGLLDFLEQSSNFPDVKPIIGAEFFLSDASRFEKRPTVDGQEKHIVLLVQSEAGYKNLLQLISKSHLEGFFNQPRIDWELLTEHAEGLICLTGSADGYIGSLWHQQGESKAIESLERLNVLFNTRLYLELCARPTDIQQNYNQFLSSQTNLKLPFVVTTDARFALLEDEEAAETLYSIGKNRAVGELGQKGPLAGNWFKPWEVIVSELSYLEPELLESARLNTLKVSEAINFEMQFGQDLLPAFEVPEGETTATQLLKECEAEIPVRYATRPDLVEEAHSRLAYELSIIGKMGFESYFLITSDFINFAKKNGIAVGPGRGSAAGSIVSYLLGITNIDPLHYELLFERFLNPERISMPDIDIDFSDERREEVLQYVIEKYGTDKVSKVCTFGTLAAKAALKDVGRALGVPYTQMNHMTKLLPNKPGFTLKDAEEIKEFTTFVGANPALKKVFELGKKLEGCVRHVSVHACAVIIGENNLSFNSPLQWAPGAEELKITQYPYQQLEHVGLLKMDFLGLKNLSVIEKAIQNIKLSQGIELDLNTITLDDKKTFSMLAEGETTGVFQFESAGMRRYMRELKPTELEDLVAMNALYRPGPMEYIPEYIKGKHKPKSVKYLHKDLEQILNKTYGIAVYQEQVLRIAQEFAGYSLGEADILRKAIGKKIAAILAEQREKFINGAVSKGYDKKLAIKIFDEIVVPFSGYGFNRSHAVCYARIAYETAYLRANYPVEFMAAMMTTDRNNTDRIVLEMNECQTMGIQVLPPSVNESGSHFTVIKAENRNQTTIEASETVYVTDQCIRFGLTAIKGLGEETVNQIIFERNRGGAFKNLQDFAKRVPAKLMNKKTLEALAYSGAFDDFGDRKAIVDSLDELAGFARDFQHKQESGQMGLFGGADEAAIEFTLRDTVATKEDILKWERESLGLFVSDHPLKGLKNYFSKYGILIGNLSEAEDVGQQRTIHALVTASRQIITKAGKNMAILTLEDTSGKIEAAIFPKIYSSIPRLAMEVDAFVRVQGKIDDRDGVLNCIVNEMKVGDLKKVQSQQHLFESAKESVSDAEEPELYEILIPSSATKAQIADLKSLLRAVASTSKTAVGVQVQLEGKKIPIPLKVNADEALESKIAAIFK
jgi:DNA polymerase-3 subunit alpha